MPYHLAGLMSAIFVSLSLCGIAAQLRLILRRKQLWHEGGLPDGRPSAVLSLNRFATSYLSFFAMFLYGLTLESVNHYLVWPRTLAMGLLLTILFEIWNDRRDRSSLIAFGLGVVLLVSSIALGFSDYRIAAHSTRVTHALVIFAMVLYLQGAAHQVMKIRRTGSTGALSLPMHQLYFVKDASSLVFGFTMGLESGWPVFVFHALSLSVQSATMWHFRWVRVSRKAREIRTRHMAMTGA